MDKKAFVFPGQGSQYVGMGEEIAKKYPEAKNIFNIADDALGFKISDICFNGTKEVLKKTYYTQPAILTASIACYTAFSKKYNGAPDYVCGHSLGEYTALVVSGALKFEEAVKLVYKRGKFMEEAASDGKGGMAAVLGLDMNKVKDICIESSYAGVVEPVNLNCPGQVVIAGEKEAVEEAVKNAIEGGARKAMNLGVSGPFHSSLMAAAADKLAEALKDICINDPKIPVVLNWTGENAVTGDELRKGLIKQINNPVLWDKSIRNLTEQGVGTIIEVGPGKVLSGLIKNINKGVNVYNVDNAYTLNNTLNKMEEKNNAS